MECPVCFHSYAAEPHTPKVLPCGHTVCAACVRALCSGDHAGLASCPVCRARCSEADISTNFALREAAAGLAAAALKGRSAAAGPRAEPAAAGPGVWEGLSQPLLRGGGAPAAQAPAAAPGQQTMPPAAGDLEPSAPPLDEAAWQVGPENVYEHATAHAVEVPAGLRPADDASWEAVRRPVLYGWGEQRERFMHRRPRCLMDQMVSGSGFYPPRMLHDSWFTDEELAMSLQLESLLEGTGHSRDLARDMLAARLYDVDVRIILDNSGSMQADMFGQTCSTGMSQAWIDMQGDAFNANLLMGRTFANMRQPRFNASPAPPQSPYSPSHRRWFFAREALRQWKPVYNLMGMDPWVYLLNPMTNFGNKVPLSRVDAIFADKPGGRTPMTQAIQRALQDHREDLPSSTLLLLILTDGEADDMVSFNAVLDRIQNQVFGDVQACFMGLSLVPRDIEWFENEECDETRIRTVEAYEVEQRQIQLREVVSREGAYNFYMHTFRVLVTNFFPADYDYEAPLQNFRHRLYITLHGRDRWYGLNNVCWKCAVSNLLCSACFIATCCHCNGWCQGNECGKMQYPECLESCFEQE